MLYTVETIKTKKNDILKAAMSDYEKLKESDKRAAAEQLRPGESLKYPSLNGFYSEQYREHAVNVLNEYRFKIGELLKEVNEEIGKKAVEAPTNEQTNLINVLSIGKPTKEELQTVLNANMNNYAMYNAINRLASENGIYLDNAESPMQELINTKNSLTSAESVLNIVNAEQRLTPGFISFCETME